MSESGGTRAKMFAAMALLAASSACSDTGGATDATGGASSGGSGGVGGTGSFNSTGGTGGAGDVDLSSDPGSGKCMNFTPCGGDVLGTWRVESLCMAGFPPNFDTCPTAQTTFAITGTLTFGSDGTYTARGSSKVSTTVPASCAALCSTSCTTAAGGGCVCELVTPISETPLSYAAEGNKLILHPRADVTQTAYFCRKGGQLLMRGYSTASVVYQYDLSRQ